MAKLQGKIRKVAELETKKKIQLYCCSVLFSIPALHFAIFHLFCSFEVIGFLINGLPITADYLAYDLMTQSKMVKLSIFVLF